jgi:hypothetical protein
VLYTGIFNAMDETDNNMLWNGHEENEEDENTVKMETLHGIWVA